MNLQGAQTRFGQCRERLGLTCSRDAARRDRLRPFIWIVTLHNVNTSSPVHRELGGSFENRGVRIVIQKAGDQARTRDPRLGKMSRVLNSKGQVSARELNIAECCGSLRIGCWHRVTERLQRRYSWLAFWRLAKIEGHLDMERRVLSVDNGGLRTHISGDVLIQLAGVVGRVTDCVGPCGPFPTLALGRLPNQGQDACRNVNVDLVGTIVAVTLEPSAGNHC